MCHHYRGSRNPPEHLVEEFSIRSNLSQLGSLFDAYPLKPVQVVRLDPSGNRELVDCEWGLLPLWWKPSDKVSKRSAFQRKCFNAKSETAHEKPAFCAFKRRIVPANERIVLGDADAHATPQPRKRPTSSAGQRTIPQALSPPSSPSPVRESRRSGVALTLSCLRRPSSSC
jgi:hypothetical protein